MNNEKSPITAERILLQPFHLLLAVERNLSPWYTKIPALLVNVTMGEFKIFLGQDDLEEFAKFGVAVGAKVTAALETMGNELLNINFMKIVRGKNYHCSSCCLFGQVSLFLFPNRHTCLTWKQ